MTLEVKVDKMFNIQVFWYFAILKRRLLSCNIIPLLNWDFRKEETDTALSYGSRLEVIELFWKTKPESLDEQAKAFSLSWGPARADHVSRPSILWKGDRHR